MKSAPSKSLFRQLLLMILAAMLAVGCALPRDRALYPISGLRYPGFEDDMRYDGLALSIRLSIDYLQRVPSDRQFKFGEDSYSADQLIDSLEQFLVYIQQRPSANNLRKFIKTNYRVYKSIGGEETERVLFTGYYEPLLEGRAERDESFTIPVLGRPADLVKVNLAPFADKYKGQTITGRFNDNTLVPYFDRKEIEQNGALEKTAPVLAWVEDLVDLFFLQIQGSGRIYLDNGADLIVHYDSSNGRPYRSIGRLLIDEGKIPLEEMSVQRIRSYLRDNPLEVHDILNYNPSYVFFRIEEDLSLIHISEPTRLQV